MKKILKAVPVVIIGIILNAVGRYIAHIFNLPIWLDMTGTVIASYYGGLWSGIIAGLLNNLISSFYDMTALTYSVTSVFAAAFIHFFIKKGYVDNPIKAVLSSFWLGVMCTVVSTPMNLIVFGGYSGNVWGDTLVDMLKWYDVPLIPAVLAGEVVVEIIDKQVCVLLACLIIYAVKWVKKAKSKHVHTTALLLALALTSALAVQSIDVSAEENSFFLDNFVEKIYNNTNGMVSSEANVICETDDGFIWIGSYAGLTKYDGNEFEFVREGGLVNVVSMMTDSKGRLWIGTNDAGIARYENGAYTYFTKEDGLPSNSVRCFAEDNDGNVYVGTSGKICKFSADDKIEISQHDITFATSMAVYNNMLLVIDNNGGIHALDGEKRLAVENEENSEFFYYCLAPTSDGLLVGTETGELFAADAASGGIVLKKQTDIDLDRVSAVFEDSRSRIWIASVSGFGYIGQDGEYREMSFDGFDSSISYFHEDYQGNIWIASTRYGVMKLSESAFINVFDKVGAENQVVNAVVRYKGNYFCGTDKGLIVFNENGLSSDFDELIKMTDGYRVRSVFADSKDGLWICTYSGLIYYASDGSVRCYNTETDGVTSDRFRCITELSDGTAAVGTADGINFIKDGNIIGTLTAGDGLENTQILSIVEGSDGTVWAGSDGSGIYIISDGKLMGSYTVENGLSSNVILRIVPWGNKFIIVTSNALCCIDQDGKVRKLASFPYFNNYDVIIRNETAYITCSAGMYEMALSELLADKCEQLRLYGAGEGLFSGLTANSWNYVSDDGSLYLCSNNGVIAFNENVGSSEANLKFGIISVECDKKPVEATDENSFIVPGDARNLSVYASVRNYAFSDLKVRFFIKELDNNPKIYSWNEIEPIRIFKPESSEYNICLQLLDSSGKEVLQEKVYTVGTEMRAWEKPEFRTYLIAVVSEISLFALISIVSFISFVIRKNELEKLRDELENKISEQTSELINRQKEIKDLFIQTVTALSEAVDAKDRYTSGHSKRVAEYSRMIAARMGKSK
ncbi:MAG: two-component regulator propeller domain-containing protein, partial [Oscillospiraceae bacterium]